MFIKLSFDVFFFFEGATGFRCVGFEFCPGTRSVDQASLELTEIHQTLLGLKTYAPMQLMFYLRQDLSM